MWMFAHSTYTIGSHATRRTGIPSRTAVIAHAVAVVNAMVKCHGRSVASREQAPQPHHATEAERPVRLVQP
jgi:hypothetical protein